MADNKTVGHYFPSGYPRYNPKFWAEAAKVLERGKPARERYEAYVREWTAFFRKKLLGE